MISVYGTQGTINGNQVSDLEDNVAIETLLSDETMIDTEGLETQYTPVYSVLSLEGGTVPYNQMTMTDQQELLEILGYPSSSNSFVLLEDTPEIVLAELNLGDILDNLPNVGDVLDNVKDAVGNVLDNLPDVADVLDNVKDAVGDALDNVGDVLGNVGDAVGNVLDKIGGAGGGIGNILGNLFGKGD